MSILDTTEVFRSIYTQEYVPFDDNSYKNKDNNPMNFCPKCHKNYNSHHHKEHCFNLVPIGDEIIPFSILIMILIIYKRWK